MRRSLLSGVVTLGLVLAAAVTGAQPASAAVDTGSITGRLVTATGEPVPWANVYVFRRTDFDLAGEGSTDSAGSYTVAGLLPGSYAVSFYPQSHPEQWFDNKKTSAEADAVSVTAGQATVVNEDLDPLGAITGRLVDAAGNPLAYRTVRASNEDGPGSDGMSTDEDGRYRLAVPAGRYVVSWEPVEGSWQSQYVPGKLHPDSAQRFTVTAGQEAVVDDTALPTGGLSGRLTTAAGEPVADAEVALSPERTYYGTGGYVRTDVDGAFSIPHLLVGDYTVGFFTDARQQYYDGALDRESATLVSVTAGGSTEIQESWLGTGSVRVAAVDAVTGAPVADFCVRSECSGGTGAVTLTDLPAGVHEVNLYTEDGSYFSRAVDVRARADRTTTATVKMRPAGRITTTIVDRVTGAPVRGVCARAFKPKRVHLPDGYGDCSDAQGRLSLGLLTAGTYRLFVDPVGAAAYGRQWLGAEGGTGDERQAAALTVTVGTVTTAPRVLLDRAGSIQGTITDAGTGAPVSAGVTLLSASAGSGAGDVSADAQGRYRMDRLGPYAWPLRFTEYGYAQQWSGNQPTRFTATPVTVTSGAAAAYDIALGRGTVVTGTVTLDGAAPDRGRLEAHSTDTGDHTGVADFEGSGPYSMRVLGDQRITFEYHLSVGEQSYHETRVALPPAEPGGPVRYAVRVPASGTLTVDIAATRPTEG